MDAKKKELCDTLARIAKSVEGDVYDESTIDEIMNVVWMYDTPLTDEDEPEGEDASQDEAAEMFRELLLRGMALTMVMGDLIPH